MKQLFVTYDVAKELKGKSFDEPCLGYFADKELRAITTENGNDVFLNLNFDKTDIHIYEKEILPAPLVQQVIIWLLYAHNLYIVATSTSQESWQWHIQFPGETLNKKWAEDFASYEEALEDAILEAIKLI